MGILAVAISMTHSDMFYRLDISTFLWIIAVLDFHPFEIYKNLVLPMSIITFTVDSHTDNHFYKYIGIYISFKYYTV